MKRRTSLWKTFLRKGFALFTILMMLGQMSQGTVSVLAKELAVGDNGALDVSLLYGDKQDHPGGMAYSTGDTMSGYIQITPKNLTTDLDDVAVNLVLPGKYLDDVNIPDFNSSSQHDAPVVTKVGDDYHVTLHFTNYQKSEVLTLPFIAKFKLGFPPTNYSMDITGTLNINGAETALNSITWKPQYKDYILTKFVNQNYDATMSRDYAEASPGIVTGADGKKYIEKATSVPFAFLLDGMRGQYNGSYRQLESATITDKLPTYTDKDGKTRTAVLDTEKSEGWVDNGDGTVSKTFVADENKNVQSYHSDLMQKIQDKSFLYLKFPDLVMEKDQTLEDVLVKDLTNTASVVGIPAERGEGEPDVTAEDSLIFRLTSRDLEGKGAFAKQADGNVYDSTDYKSANYKWLLKYNNITPFAQKNVVFYDEQVDSRLKFTKIEYTRMMIGNYGNGPLINQYVKRIILTMEDGSTKEIQPEADKDGFGSTDLTKYGTVVGWILEMKDDFELPSGQGIYISTYTAFKDPEKTHIDENDEAKNAYENTGRITYKTQSGADRDQSAKWQFKLLPLTENVNLTKNTDYNNVQFTDGRTIRFALSTDNVRLDPGKDYKDLRVIDLFDPNTLDIDFNYLDQYFDKNNTRLYAPWYKSYEVIENYHNSGRSALIIHLDQKEFIKRSLETGGQVRLPFIYTKLKGKADGGTFTNHIYMAGEGLWDLETANPNKVAVDSYDLNNNGSTTDKIPHAESNYTIVAAEGVYSRKFIAKNDDLSDASTVTRTFKPGETFNYKLTIKNNTDKPVENTVIYDVLPKVGDVNTLDASARKTEYTVSLRGPITAPEGWTAYYTTDTTVTASTMAQAADKDIWSADITDFSKVTGIKIVANEGTTIGARSQVDIAVPVVNPSELTDQVKQLMLDRTEDNKDNGGRSGVVQAHNQFGYKAKGHEGNRESNTVTSQIFGASFHVKKVDKDDTSKGLAGAEFNLLDASGAVLATQVSDKDGNVAFTTLTEGTYTLKETKAPTNYKLDETEHAVVVTYDADQQIYHVTIDGEAIGSKASPKLITNENDIKYLNLEATKVWDDQDNVEGLRPESIEFQLYKNGKAEGKPVALSAGSDWKVTFSNLPDKDSNGNLISYTVKEVKVPTYYTVDKEEAQFVDGKATITNKRTPETTEVTVKKVWDDAKNQDGLRPASITVHLLANGEKVQTATVSGESETWSHTFTNLPVYKNGQKIIYTVTEDTVANYTTTIDATTITNTYKPGKTSLTVTKKWDDAENQDGLRPKTIKVQLYADGQELGKVVELSEDNKWTYTFSELDEKKDDKAVQYTVKETEVPEGYTQTVEATNPGQVVITNSHTPSKTKVQVTKKWDDANNQDGLRPKEIRVQLYAGDQKLGKEVVLSADNKWTHTFEKLAEKANGQDIHYSVKEVDVPEGYTVTEESKEKGDVVLTNTHTPSTVDIPVTKIWVDNDNQDGLRPAKITVKLLANGGEVARKDITSETDWKDTFTGLPKFKDGKEIVYTLQEEKVENYSPSIDQESYTITNTHTPGKTTLSVTKQWDDQEDKDGLRPKSVKVQLYADGKKSGEVIELSAENKWTHTFADSDKNVKGKAITYTVEEVDVPTGYQVTKTDDGQGNVVLTNKHEPSIPPTTTTEEPKKKVELPNTGSTESILSLILALTGVSLAAYLLKKKKN
ncbi:Cna B-type domain-containing protein [Streptococcus sp. oral taxon 431]|uniref:Cna B-type domain-containing protein n=1 Tax=Streptococcus sp. oral taxon 431 TaxID=712633 RepID=UPI002000FB48|nr:Cna B-type domain-containing protein [Streptococcus sp. oral taxon 431]